MTKELIQKLLKGETLTEEERQQLEQFDPEATNKQAIDAAAAAARRKAEEELAKARKDLEAATEKATGLEAKVAQYEETIKGNAQQGNAELKVMKAQLEALNKRAEEADAKAARLEKNARIDAIIAKAGFHYAAGFDEKAINGLLHAKLDALDDAGLKEIEDAATPFESLLHGGIFKAHKESWKGALLDESGAGSGSPIVGSAGAATYQGPNPWKKDSTNLTERMRISKENPQLAAQLKAQAGFQDPVGT